MRSLFNSFALFSKKIAVLKSIFQVARDGMDIEAVCQSAATLTNKFTHLRTSLDKEGYDVHKKIADGSFLAGMFYQGLSGSKDPWGTILDSLLFGCNLAKTGYLAEDYAPGLTEERLAAVGRIKYQTEIFQTWYLAQDPRIKPLFNTIADANGQDFLLLSLYPKGQHIITVNGTSHSFDRP